MPPRTIRNRLYEERGVGLYTYKFTSTRELQELLGLSPPFSTCYAHAPYAKNAPHCTRSIHKNNQASVPGLLMDIVDCDIPSSTADQLLRRLSRCAVCGIGIWHQDQAMDMYEKWSAALWGEFLDINGLAQQPAWVREQFRSVSRSEWMEWAFSLQVGVEEVAPDERGYEDDGDSDVSSDTSEVFSDFDAAENVTTETVFENNESSSGGSFGQAPESAETTTGSNVTPNNRDDSSDDEPIFTPAESEHGEDPSPSFESELLSLAQNLAEEAPADSNPSSSSDPASPAPVPLAQFRPYSNVHSQSRLLKELLNKLPQTVTQKKLHAGYIYAFRRPGVPGFLKIGYTNDVIKPRRARPDPVDHRLAVWSTNCGYVPELVFRVHVPHAVERVERLVHKTFQMERRVQNPPCARCARGRRGKGRHNEWFEVEEDQVRKVVGLWKQFSVQNPYDRFGRLNEFWSQLAADEKKRVASSISMLTWVEEMPGHVEKLRGEDFASTLTRLEFCEKDAVAHFPGVVFLFFLFLFSLFF